MAQWTPAGFAIFYGVPMVPVLWCVYRGYRRRLTLSALDGSSTSFFVLAAMFSYSIVLETILPKGASVVPAIVLAGVTAVIFGPVFVVRGLLGRGLAVWIEVGVLLLLAVFLDGLSVLSLFMGGAA